MYLFVFLLFCLNITSETILEALPKQIILIRHAEKEPKGRNLSLKGFERSEALVAFFGGQRPENRGDFRVTKHGLPIAIYAQNPSHPNSSLRPIQTVQPLANALHLTLQTQFIRDEHQKLVNSIKDNPAYNGRMVLISWASQSIPAIAHAFGAINAPNEWPKEAFDRLWVITYHKNGSVEFQNLPQRLLFGDSQH